MMGVGMLSSQMPQANLLTAIKAVLTSKLFVRASLTSHFLVAMALTTVQTVHFSWLLTLFTYTLTVSSWYTAPCSDRFFDIGGPAHAHRLRFKLQGSI